MKMSVVASVVFALFASRGALGFTFHMPKLGGCPDLAAYPDLLANMGDFVGTWFVQSSANTAVLQGKGRCMTADYKYIPIQNRVVVSSKQIGLESNKWESVEATATPTNETSGDGKFDVKFTIPIWGEVGGKYTVLGTDFQTYSVIHGCGSFWGILHYECSWVVSRKQQLTPEEEQEFHTKTNEVLNAYSNSIDSTEFQKVDQTNCHDEL